MNTIPENGTFELGLIDLISEQGKVNVSDFCDMTFAQYGDEIVKNTFVAKLRKYKDLFNTPQVMKNVRDQILTYFQLVIFLMQQSHLIKYQYFELDPSGYILVISDKYCNLALKYKKTVCINIDNTEDLIKIIKNINFIFVEPNSHALALSMKLNEIELVVRPNDIITFYDYKNESLENNNIVSYITIFSI